MDINLVRKHEGRFWERVRRTTGCWEWIGAHSGGYGSVVFPGYPQVGTHRVAWALIHRRWPQRAILHHCGNPGCVNPDHLYEGDAKDNARDAKLHGVLPRGEKHGNAKLSDSEVSEIRMRYAGGEGSPQLAQAFGVTAAQIFNIVNGKQRGQAAVYIVLHCPVCASEFKRKRVDQLE